MVPRCSTCATAARRRGTCPNHGPEHRGDVRSAWTTRLFRLRPGGKVA